MSASITFTTHRTPRRDFALETAETIRSIADQVEEHADASFGDGEAIEGHVYGPEGVSVGTFTITEDIGVLPVEKATPNPVFMTELTGHYMGYIVRMWENPEYRQMLLNTYSETFDEDLTASTPLSAIMRLATEDIKQGPANYVFRQEFRSYLDAWGMTNHNTDELFTVSFA